MCGIAGFTKFNSIPGDMTTLLNMGNAIAHRGPDANGEYLDEMVGLCHRRLSIIDLSKSGNQPMISRDGNHVLVFNGEIYNFLELKRDLTAKGHVFRTQTDTEVILALYEEEGMECLSRLNGMFAFALWDKQKKTLYVARDRLGKKPFYYYYDGKNFLFASEIKALLESTAVKKDIRPDAIYDFFTYQYIPDPKTIFKNVNKLKPGHWMEVTAEGINETEYWDVSFNLITPNSEEEIGEELYHIMEKSVKQRMISDVPLGAFLSGGIDSSAIVGLMARNQSAPITTCSIGFDVEKFNEIEYARSISNIFSTNHHEFIVKEKVEHHLKHIVSFFDEPFADPSLIPTYFVSKLARQKVTVALAGDGGDENFAGYGKYTTDRTENRLRSVFPAFIRHNTFPALASLFSSRMGKISSKGSTLLNTLSRDPGYGFFLTNAFFKDSLWNHLINDDFKKELSGYHPSSITENYYHKADTDDHLSKILYTDIKTYLPGGILTKVDRVSMANSLEVRAPLLDYRLVEYAASIPSSLKFKKSEKKYILKQCLSNLLPHEILYRKKMGFSVPLAHWLRNDLRHIAESCLFAPHSGISNFFNLAKLKQIWLQHLSGNRDYSNELWSFLMFELWWENYIN